MLKRNQTNQHSERLILLLILAVGLFLRCLYFIGIGGYDDISYLSLVTEILDGSFSTEFVFNGQFPFRYRAGILFPTAAMYSIFGPSEYVAAVFPLFISMATIWLAWRAGKLFSTFTAALAALLMATLPIAIVSATSLLPTLFSAFFCGLAIVLWIELEGLHRSPLANRGLPIQLMSARMLQYFVVGLSLGVAYLFRIEASISGLVFIAFALIWWKPNRGWWIAACGIVVVIGAENIFYYLLHDQWFYRLKMISQGFAEIAALGGSGSPIPNAKSPMVYINTLFFKPTVMGLHGAAFVFAALVSLLLVRRSAVLPLLIWFWIWLLYLSFGTWSFDTYVPTTKNPRYLQNICLPGVVLLAYVIARMIEQRGILRLAAGVGLCMVMCGSFVLLNLSWVYRYENAAGSRVAAQLVRSELASRGVDVSQALIQAEYHTASNLMHFVPEATITPISHADIALGDTLSGEKEVSAGYVVHDQFVAEKYRTVVGYRIPAVILEPPSTWELMGSRQRPYNRFQYRVVEYLSQLTGGRIQGIENSLKPGDLSLYSVSAQ